jgi:hypothetical protein
MEVAASSRDGCVSERRLDKMDWCASFERVGCVRVPEPVRRCPRIHCRASGGIFHDSENSRAIERLAGARLKYRHLRKQFPGS